jgi:hypothetical protein
VLFNNPVTLMASRPNPALPDEVPEVAPRHARSLGCVSQQKVRLAINHDRIHHRPSGEWKLFQEGATEARETINLVRGKNITAFRRLQW